MRIALIIFIGMQAFAQTLYTGVSEGMKYSVERVVQGLSIPWGMDFIDKDNLLISQKNGKVVLVNTKNGNLQNIEVQVPNLLVRGQGGLLDVAYHKSGWVYFTYVKDKYGQGVTTLARAKLEKSKLTQWQDLLVTNSATNTGRHFGSRIIFDESGYVYFGIGDRGERPMAQDRSNHIGAVIRLHLDGSVPKDNPFGSEIYSYGHRNPQGLFYDMQSGTIFSNEHGPRGGDEINVVQRGKNYGWPVISYGKEYWGPVAVGESTEKEGMEQPIYQFTPSIAPSSLIVYKGEAFPKWKGDLLSGALKLTHLNRIVIDSSKKVLKEERLLDDMNLRIRNIKESPQGYLYLATDNGWILRLKPQ